MESNLENLVNWLEQRRIRVSSYVPIVSINHPVLKETRVIDGIICSIKNGDMNAIELGCELVIDNKRIPFGKALKYKVISALKQQIDYISPEYRSDLSNLAVELMSLKYPPRELRELCKLIKKFDGKYTQDILARVNLDTNEALRWTQYLSQ